MGWERAVCKRGEGMNVKDLGELSGPVLLFGGPYSNLQAFAALTDAAARLSIPPDRMICTGDVVAYCADAEATTQAILALGCTVVAGNCEKQLALGADDCGCGFEGDSTCSMLSQGWYPYANAQISVESREWMAACPDIAVFTLNGRRFAIIHGGVTDISRFIWPVTEDETLLAEFDAVEKMVGPVDGIIAGHSGIPFVREIGARVWINAGAIGMPPNDGEPEGRYVVLGDAPRIVRLTYDFKAARAAMEGAGLTQGYHSALETGLWPSEDSLPPIMRRS